MKIFYNKVFKNYFLLVCCLFLLEVFFKLFNGISLFNWSIIRIFLGVNMVCLIFGFLYSFCGRIVGNALTIITAFIFTIYSILQTGFYNFIGTFMSLGNLSQLDVVTDYFGDYIASFRWYYWIMLLPFIGVVAYYVLVEHKIHVMEMNELIDFSDKFDSEERKDLNNRKRRKELKNTIFAEKASAIIAIGLLTGFYYSTFVAPFMQNELQIKTNSELLVNPDLPNIANAQLGFVVYSLTDSKSLLFPASVKVKYDYADGYTIQEQKQSGFTRKINDTIWKKAIEDEYNSSYKTLSNYYISQSITDENDYTGLFAGKNLIVIMMESVNNVALNPSYYPNLYKLYSEGWSWDNSFSPRNSCPTGNNEMAGMVSLYTINNKCSANAYMNNVYPESIFNLFNEAGYTTSSYHNYTDQYYFRKIIHNNMGSGHYYGVQELGIPYSDVYEEWPSDVELMKKFLKNSESDEKYMAWITTVSTHHPYGVSSELGDLYLDTFANTNYSTPMKRYMSKMKVLDEAIGVLLDGLEKQGKLDDTVIVLYGDNYPYGLKTEYLTNYFGHDMSKYNEVDKTPFIIYNSAIKATKFNEYTSYINITPTVANLFGLDYDPRYYAGHDILSKDYENRVIFSDGSWRDDVAFYDATSGKITFFSKNFTYSNDEIKSINNSIKNRITMSNLAIKTNYFNYLNNRFKEYTVSPISGEAELVTDSEAEKK